MKLHSMWKIIIICILLFSITTPSFAGFEGFLEHFIERTKKGEVSENFNVDKFETSTTSEVEEITGNVFGQVIGLVRIIGAGIAIIILIVVACKYMMSAPGDRADIKRHAIPFVIGAIVLFGATGILGIIADFAGNVK